MNRLACLAVMLSACATAPLAISTEPIKWGAVGERWSVHIVTEDPDGSERVTRVWLAILDEAGVIRTGGTRWFENLRRSPELRLRVSGVDHPLRVAFVEDPEQQKRIDRAFLEKYGWQERIVTGLQPRDGDDFFMRLMRPDPRLRGAPVP